MYYYINYTIKNQYTNKSSEHSYIKKKIPRIIHQIYITRNPRQPIPSSILNNIQQLKKKNPGWKYKLYREDDIIKFITKYYDLHTLYLYNKINKEYGAARADFFRYLLVYKLGGVYLDIKSNTHIPLDSIIKDNDEFILSNWKVNPTDNSYLLRNHMHSKYLKYPPGEFQNWHIISSPKHLFLKKVIEKVKKNILEYKSKHIYQKDSYKNNVGKMGVLKTTGPIMYTQTILPLLNNNVRYRIIKNHKENGLVYSMFNKNNPSSYNSTHLSLFQHYSTLTSPIIT
jgi:mannosyltransferase OCH1-like enzyme